jgi:hypothetical protein
MEPVRGAIEHPYDVRHSLLIVPLHVALGGGEDAKRANQEVEELVGSTTITDEEIKFAIRHGKHVRGEQRTEVQAWLTSLFPRYQSDIHKAFLGKRPWLCHRPWLIRPQDPIMGLQGKN